MIQDQRIIATSAVQCVGNTLLLQGRVYSPPYVIKAIGDPDDAAGGPRPRPAGAHLPRVGRRRRPRLRRHHHRRRRVPGLHRPDRPRPRHRRLRAACGSSGPRSASSESWPSRPVSSCSCSSGGSSADRRAPPTAPRRPPSTPSSASSPRRRPPPPRPSADRTAAPSSPSAPGDAFAILRIPRLGAAGPSRCSRGSAPTSSPRGSATTPSTAAARARSATPARRPPRRPRQPAHRHRRPPPGRRHRRRDRRRLRRLPHDRSRDRRRRRDVQVLAPVPDQPGATPTEAGSRSRPATRSTGRRTATSSSPASSGRPHVDRGRRPTPSPHPEVVADVLPPCGASCPAAGWPSSCSLLLLAALVVAVLFLWVFPAVAPHLPFEDVTIEPTTGATP